MPITDILKNINIPYNYIVGSKTTGTGLNVNTKLSIDPDFKKTLLRSVLIFTIGVSAGIATGIVLSKKRK